MPKYILSIGLMIALSALIGCSSGGGNDVTTPDEPMGKSAGETSHFLWGLWQFAADLEGERLDVIPLRGADMQVNVLQFLEPPPLVYLTLDSLEFNGSIIEADIGLRHPFLGLTEFTGFDVCGILITNGHLTGFSDSDIRMAGDEDTRNYLNQSIHIH